MDLKTLAWEGMPAEGDRASRHAHESGWRAFLGSLRLGVVLAVACVLGLIAIFSADPFASASVSERVTEKLGRPASCTEVGAARITGVSSPIYRCTVGSDGRAPCFVVSGQEIKQLSGSRALRC